MMVKCSRDEGEGRVVVITGGASRIGAGCTRHFSAWLARGRQLLPGQRTRARSQPGFGKRRHRRAEGDVSRDADCRRVADAAIDAFGRIDALVSSAGTTRLVPHWDLDGLKLDDFLTTTAVNTAGPFQIARACASALRAAEAGAIVIVSSYGAIYGTGSSIAYAASKGATNTLTMSLARVLAPEVRVNAVCPALVRDGFVQRLDPALFAQREARQIERAPLRRAAAPEDVAANIYWLAAGDTLMTGHVLSLDCGLHLNGDG